MPGPQTRVLELTQNAQRFVFVDVAEEPLLSLGRDFSAPAIFRTPHSRHERAILMGKDSDAFNRWEAGQILAAEIMLEVAGRAQRRQRRLYRRHRRCAGAGRGRSRLRRPDADAADRKRTGGQEDAGGSRSPSIPRASRWCAPSRWRIANRLAQLYEHMRDAGDFSPDARSAGRRALRNACLRYLTAADDEAAAGLADAHYRTATNMTDMIAGLAALTRMESPLRDAAFTHFHDRFRNDPLVLDKWMSLQAGSPLPETVTAVRELMKHPAFDIKNPNRVRALVGAFSVNHLRFHNADGSGYRLVGEVIRTLDPHEPAGRGPHGGRL